MTKHDDLIPFILDALAEAKVPWSSSDVSMAVTTAVRRADRDDLMVYRGTRPGGYSEVSTRQVVAAMEQHMKSQPDIVELDKGPGKNRGGRVERTWALRTKADEFGQADDRTRAAGVEARRRVTTQDVGGSVVVLVDGRKVAEFLFYDILTTKEQMAEVAESYARKLRHKLIDHLTEVPA